MRAVEEKFDHNVLIIYMPYYYTSRNELKRPEMTKGHIREPPGLILHLFVTVVDCLSHFI